MWFAALDGLIVAAIVTLAVLGPFRRDAIPAAATVVVGPVGGLVGAWLGFTLVSGSLATGPLQPTAVAGGAVGAAVALLVLRSWIVNDRHAVVAMAAAAEASAARAERDARRDSRRTARTARPVPLAGLGVLVLTVLRGRHRG